MTLVSDAPRADALDEEIGEAASPDDNWDADPIAEEGNGDVAGLDEACRRFPMPHPSEAAHALRELEWGEHLVVGRMVPSKGGTDLYLYNLHSAALFLLDEDRAHIGKPGDEILKLIDVDEFIAWIGDKIGDKALAAAMREECVAQDPYRDQLEQIQRLIALRMVQYGALGGR